jgi:hypothetical protein
VDESHLCGGGSNGLPGGFGCCYVSTFTSMCYCLNHGVARMHVQLSQPVLFRSREPQKTYIYLCSTATQVYYILIINIEPNNKDSPRMGSFRINTDTYENIFPRSALTFPTIWNPTTSEQLLALIRRLVHRNLCIRNQTQ